MFYFHISFYVLVGIYPAGTWPRVKF